MLLFIFMIGMALYIARMRSLFTAAMLFGIFSLLSAGMLTLMDAVDVAFTEAAVGAGISTVLFLGALGLTTSEEAPDSKHGWTALLIVTATGLLLAYAALDMPAYGDPNAPIQLHVAPHYLKDSEQEVGIPNVVTSVLASYRGYDTFGETTVVLTAAVGAILLLGGGVGRVGAGKGRDDEGGRRMSDTPIKMRVRETVILRVVGKALVPFILLFALYVQFHGDYGPGGGFQAGVIFAAGLILHALIFGLDALRRAIPQVVVEIGIAAGALIYGGVGVASMVLGGEFLHYGVFDRHNPAHGQHLGILLVEFGVGITVTFVMVAIFYAFAGRSRQ
ncbi:MAG TPA: DUF4040 domain-containing protein [Myxococcales bacterium]|nr:DUF4040 domain-containing protein [Myxococcales bacterium]HIK84336.1 DUF4040 domain-containing protein [Myxococcales bacterium]